LTVNFCGKVAPATNSETNARSTLKRFYFTRVVDITTLLSDSAPTDKPISRVW